MELGSVFFGLAIVVLVAAYVLRPITGKGPLRRWREYPSSLQAERERLLEAIQELDFDYSLGKVLEQDYRPQRQALATQGAQVLRRIDELNGDSE